MNLILLFDHRFYRDQGVIFSMAGYNYPFFLARYLQVFEHVTIVARVSDSLLRKKEAHEGTENDGVDLCSLGDWNGPLSFQRRKPAIQHHLRALFEKNDGAILAITPGQIGFFAAESLRRSGRPYGVEVVGDPYDTFSPGAFHHPFRGVFQWYIPKKLREICRGASAAAYVTTAALQQRYPCPNYSVGVSDINLADEAYAATPRVHFPHRKDGGYELICVGNMAQMYKAQDVLLDALALCIKRKLPLRLTLIGEGKHRQELAQRCARLGIADHVVFRGQLSSGAQIRDALEQADLFVLPSRQEGLPRAMVEAMASALPCLGSRIGGIPELLDPEMLVAAGDAQGLADKIAYLIAHPALLQRMSQENLHKARAFSNSLLHARRIAFYEHLRSETAKWHQAKK